jgi:tetratricopeptide (TPR) repeat protein
MPTLNEAKAALEAARAALRAKLDARIAHAFAKLVDDAGYTSAALDPKFGFAEFVKEIKASYEKILLADPDDAVSLNNLGVFLSNGGKHRMARPYFVSALKLAPADATIHKNLRTADILCKTPEARWHAVPEGLKPGPDSLKAFFDPQGM